MTRSPLSFKGTDMERAIKSAIKAGLHVIGFEVNPKTGSILVHVGKADEARDIIIEDGNPWDKALRP